MKTHGGKGDTPRPKSVSDEEYATRWDAIFGRDIKEEHEIVEEKDSETTVYNKS